MSRHAPNLTHLMSRTTFAGAKFDLRKDTEACTALGVDVGRHRRGCGAVPRPRRRSRPGSATRRHGRRWPPTASPGRTGTRGMPNLQLTEDQIDLLVAYLTTLK